MINYPDYWVKNEKLCELVESTLQDNKPFAWLFVGPAGCGKTAMAELVFELLRKQYRPNWYLTASYIYNKYIGYVSSKEADKQRDINSLNQYFNNELWVLDDLGREIISEASTVFFANLFSEQYEAYTDGKKHRCIVTTNLHSDQIAKRYGPHVMDRIFDLFTIIKFNNPSFREAKKVVIEL